MRGILLNSKLSESKTHRCETSKGHLVQNRCEYGCGCSMRSEKILGKKFSKRNFFLDDGRGNSE